MFCFLSNTRASYGLVDCTRSVILTHLTASKWNGVGLSVEGVHVVVWKALCTTLCSNKSHSRACGCDGKIRNEAQLQVIVHCHFAFNCRQYGFWELPCCGCWPYVDNQNLF